MIVHLTEDAQIFFSVAGGMAITAFAVSRSKYGKDWFDPWFIITKVVCVLALGLVAENE
jgi:hypothetical protein